MPCLRIYILIRSRYVNRDDMYAKAIDIMGLAKVVRL